MPRFDFSTVSSGRELLFVILDLSYEFMAVWKCLLMRKISVENYEAITCQKLIQNSQKQLESV